MGTPNGDQLKFSSKHFVYHVRMYTETYLCLKAYQPQTIVGCSQSNWSTEKNSLTECHLIHARLLIDFLIKTKSSRDDDVFAIYYLPEDFDLSLLKSVFLKDKSEEIGGRLVHLTTKAGEVLKSEQSWEIGKIASDLVPMLKSFVANAKEALFPDEIRRECEDHISKLIPIDPGLSIHPST